MWRGRSFYPRHPRGWRHVASRLRELDVRVSIHATLAGGDPGAAYISGHSAVSIHATLAGGDLGCLRAVKYRKWFLSTPPSRVATEKKVITNIVFNRFYPRHPRGWRRFFTVIFGTNYYVSIHATLAGGDYTDVRHRLPHLGFYPRHPRGWRLRFGFTCRAVQRVSIHATLAGGDRKVVDNNQRL